ncbi:MAG TPA: hypothetical protein VEI07_01585 [Planctomycetaceae bacterium]|nr:hypothetical protein [Planctomycetaceae bacterium]
MDTETPQASVKLKLPGWRQPRTAATPTLPASARLPRITRLMALAIKFQDMVDSGEVRDYADLARLGYVTRARITQIMNLLLLAPDIQEKILIDLSGAFSERHIRVVLKDVEWDRQRRALQPS